MRFAPTDEHEALRRAVRELLDRECPPAVVRQACAGVDSRPLWTRLAGIGLIGATVPEMYGGLGIGETGTVPLLVEVGYAAVPAPVVETVLVAAPLLAEAGDPDGRLPSIVDGSARVALVGPGGLCPYGRHAELFLCISDRQAAIGTGTVEPVSTVDKSRAAGNLMQHLARAVTDDRELLERAIGRRDLGTAALLIGLCRRMLDLTVAYVRQRRQFGVPVGSFQAVKHQLADALLAVEFAEPAVLRAAWSVEHRTGTRSRDVSMAVVLAAEAAGTIARTAIQCHGAIGYTVEYDLHLYAKRAWALIAGCEVDRHLYRIADAIGLPKGAQK
jgi:alkylation response protein AidB-like acyl-CoA dehydrogenase